MELIGNVCVWFINIDNIYICRSFAGVDCTGLNVCISLLNLRWIIVHDTGYIYSLQANVKYILVRYHSITLWVITNLTVRKHTATCNIIVRDVQKSHTNHLQQNNASWGNWKWSQWYPLGWTSPRTFPMSPPICERAACHADLCGWPRFMRWPALSCYAYLQCSGSHIPCVSLNTIRP